MIVVTVAYVVADADFLLFYTEERVVPLSLPNNVRVQHISTHRIAELVLGAVSRATSQPALGLFVHHVVSGNFVSLSFEIALFAWSST